MVATSNNCGLVFCGADEKKKTSTVVGLLTVDGSSRRWLLLLLFLGREKRKGVFLCMKCWIMYHTDD